MRAPLRPPPASCLRKRARDRPPPYPAYTTRAHPHLHQPWQSPTPALESARPTPSSADAYPSQATLLGQPPSPIRPRQPPTLSSLLSLGKPLAYSLSCLGVSPLHAVLENTRAIPASASPTHASIHTLGTPLLYSSLSLLERRQTSTLSRLPSLSNPPDYPALANTHRVQS